MLPGQVIKDLGIVLFENEIFVQYPGWDEIYGSNYGRAITVKKLKNGIKYYLREISADKSSHVQYVFSKKSVKDSMGRVVRGRERLSLTGQKLVADIFLPEYWEDILPQQLQAHHLDRSLVDDHLNDCWKNLVYLPVWLHKKIEYVKTFWLKMNDDYQQVTPYEIMDYTGLTMEEFINPIMREPDTREKYGEIVLDVYNINGYRIGYELYNPEFREELKLQGKKLGEARKNKLSD